VRGFWRLAWDANITGMSGMLAYNMLLGIIPVALLGLFVAGQVLSSAAVQQSVLNDLREVFPGTAEHTLNSLLNEIRNSTTSTGVLALIAALWLGSSFWGALDTAFSRIYGCRARPWLEQTDVVYAISLGISMVLLFTSLAVIYHSVPNRPVPWRAVWPGAIGATLAIGVVDYAFPAYLTNISTIARFGTTIVFILIMLIWFYLLALIILGGAVVNALALRHREGPC
jgi:uncharacterized BrkB/YihY/UPF0761 family membrane protein